tara:strand:+ start:601 stop:807 length:207 start_codon:yes stop_codon:yes gene_type:complete
LSAFKAVTIYIKWIAKLIKMQSPEFLHNHSFEEFIQGSYFVHFHFILGMEYAQMRFSKHDNDLMLHGK